MRTVAIALILIWSWAAVHAAEPVRIFAAASLKGPLDEAAAAFSVETKTETSIIYAASSALAKQIEQGAGADVFISADQEWMDYLQERKMIDAASRRAVLGNRLALVADLSNKAALKIEKGFALAQALGDGRLAMADPDAVPAGKYAKAALISLGVWTLVENKVARAENVRAALAFVARGEAPLGIVYTTDAKAEPKVRIVDMFPADSHPPIVYPAAKVSGARPGTDLFLAFLKGAQARGIFERAGFLVP